MTKDYELTTPGKPVLKEKTLNTSDVNGARKAVPDIEVFGNGDAWLLLCKASSDKEGWMKSTKAMHIKSVGCLVQVTTQQKNFEDDGYSLAEAVTFIPNTRIAEDEFGGRKLVKE